MKTDKTDNQTRHKQLQEILDIIDESIGFGPDEVLSETHNVDDFKKDFINKAKKYNVYEYFVSINEDTSTSWEESIQNV